MDWAIVLQIILYILAGIGVIALLLIIWLVWDDRNSAPSPDYRPRDDAFMYLDNEVRGTMRREFTPYRHNITTGEPTLKGRVDMIEKHLGIQVVVQPAKPEKLTVIKKGKKDESI